MGRVTGATYGDGVFVGDITNGDLLISGGSPVYDNHYASFWGIYAITDNAFLSRAIAGNILTQGYYTQSDITKIYAVYGRYANQFPTPVQSQTGWIYPGTPIPAPGPVPAPLPACARTNCPDAFYDSVLVPTPAPTPNPIPSPTPSPTTGSNNNLLIYGLIGLGLVAVYFLASGKKLKLPKKII